MPKKTKWTTQHLEALASPATRPGELTAAQFRKGHVDRVEHDIQSICIDWFYTQYPQLIIYAIPNGGLRDKKTAWKMKREGVRRGIPDLHLPVPTKSYPGLYIETKTPSGTPDPDQIIIHAFLRAQGYRVELVRNIEEFMCVVNEYLSEL